MAFPPDAAQVAISRRPAPTTRPPPPQACLGWKARSQATAHGLRRVASFLRIKPKKTVECDA